MADAPEMEGSTAQLSPTPGGGIAPAAITENPVGNALVGAGETAERIYRDFTQRQDLTAHLAADNQLAAFEQDRFYNPNTGGLFTQKTGNKSKDAVDSALSDYQAKMDQVVQEAPDDRTAMLIQKSNALRMQSMRQQAFHYQVTETNRYADEQSDAAISNAHQSVANDPSDININHQLEKMSIIRMDDADRKDQPPEMVNQLVQQDASRVWTSQIKTAIEQGDDGRAQALYQGHKQDIVPEHRGVVDSWVEASGVRVATQQALPGIVLDKDKNFDTDANIQQKLLDFNGSPKVKEDLQRQADTLIAQNKAATVQKQAGNFQSAYDMLKKSGWDYDSIPTTLTTGGAISPEQDQVLQNLSVKKARGQTVKDDPATYLQLDAVLSDPNRRNEAANLPLLNYADRLSDPTLKAFSKRINDAKNDNSPDLAKESLINEVTKNSLLANGQNPGADPAKNPQQAQDAAQFVRRIRDIVSENESDNKKPLNREQIQQICDDQMKTDLVNGTATPRYKIAGLTTQTQLGAQVKPQELVDWGAALTNPHAASFPANVATLVRWSQGIGDDGKPNPALPARAQSIMDQQISASDRQFMVDAWKSQHGGVSPTPDQIINVWAAHQKRVTPIQTAPPKPTYSGSVDLPDGWHMGLLPAGD